MIKIVTRCSWSLPWQQGRLELQSLSGPLNTPMDTTSYPSPLSWAGGPHCLSCCIWTSVAKVMTFLPGRLLYSLQIPLQITSSLHSLWYTPLKDRNLITQTCLLLTNRTRLGRGRHVSTNYPGNYIVAMWFPQKYSTQCCYTVRSWSTATPHEHMCVCLCTHQPAKFTVFCYQNVHVHTLSFEKAIN